MNETASRGYADALKPPTVRDAIAFSLVVALTVAGGLLTYRVFPHLPFIRELTSSGAALTDANKVRDVSLPPLLLLGQLVLFAGLVAFSVRPARGAWAAGVPSDARIERGLWIGAAAALLVLAGIVQFIAGAIAFLLLLAGAGLLHARLGELWRMGLATAACLACLVAFLAGQLGQTNLLLPLAGTFLLAVGALSALRPSAGMLRPIYGLIAAGSCVASASFAPLVWMPQARPSLLDILMLAPGLFALWQVAHWLRRPGRPLPLLPLAIAFALIATARPELRLAPADEYHFGEYLLATKALLKGGLFTRELTAHGLSDALGAIGAGFLDVPVLQGVLIGQALGGFLIATLAAWLLFGFTGPLIGLCLLLAADLSTHWLPLAAFLLILATSRIRPALLYGAALPLACAASVFTLGGIGVAVAVSAALMNVLLFRTWTFRSAGEAGIGALLGLLPLALVAPQILGELFFLRVSAATNLFVYGNNFIPPARGVAGTLRLGAVMLFMAVPAIGVALVWGGDLPRRHSIWRLLGALGLALLPLAAALLLITPYAMGRLDVVAQRAAIASLLLLTITAVWLGAPGLRSLLGPLTPRRIAGGQIVLAALVLLSGSGDGSVLRRWSAFPLLPPHAAQLRGAVDPALPGLGVAPPGAEARDVAQTLESLLRPSETFLNLTNRNALYAYLGRDVPMPVASVYNAAPKAFQAADIAALEADPPPVALIEAKTIDHDGVSLPLRSFDLYAYTVRTYRPVRIGRFIYGIRRDLAETRGPAQTSEPEADLWAEAFHREDIGRIPAAWGRSLDLLRPQLSNAQRSLSAQPASGVRAIEGGFAFDGPLARFDIDLPPAADPRREGLLRLRLACIGKREPLGVRVYWRGAGEDFAPARSIVLNASYPQNLVPLDASPRWSLGTRATSLQLEIAAPPGCTDFTLGDIALTSRRDASPQD